MKKYLKYSAILLLTGACIAAASACGKSADSSKATASVQNVGELCGVSTFLDAEKFSGVVTSGREKTVTREEGRKIGQVCVQKGDTVAEGQILFIYDAEDTKNSLEKAQLELQQMQNALSSKRSERDQLAADKKKARDSEQLDYTLQIAEAETDIREQQYNIGLKQKEIDKLNHLLQNLDVKAPFDGRIESIGSTDSNGENGDALTTEDTMSTDAIEAPGAAGGGAGFIKIVETDQVRIKGSVNEMQIGMVAQGMPMVIRSRIDTSKTWNGTVESVQTSSPESDDSGTDTYYSDGSDQSGQSSRYAFYISISDHEGLMIGQHVYIEPDEGQTEASSQTIRLPASFISDADANPWVWAEDDSGLLEKRSIKTGTYDSGDDTWEITEGLTADDYIAYPDDSYAEGMACIEEAGAGNASESALSMSTYDMMSGAVQEEEGMSSDSSYEGVNWDIG